MAYSLQSGDQLRNRRSEDNKMSGRVWKAVEIKARKAQMAKTKGRIKKAKKRGRINEEKKDKKERNDRCKESKRGMENIGWGKRSSKIRRKGKEISTGIIS